MKTLATSILILAGSLFLAGCINPQGRPNNNPSNKQAQTEINSFEQCVAAGNPVMESFPEQCRTKDGRSFTRELTEEEKKNLQPPKDNAQPGNQGGICTDKCGDNTCQEIVCMGEGCPCAETFQTCPQDCKTNQFPN